MGRGYNQPARVLSIAETLLVGGGDAHENWFVNGNFTRYTSVALGNTIVVETTYIGAGMGPGGGTLMHGQLQS
jgi:hypothetical protein